MAQSQVSLGFVTGAKLFVDTDSIHTAVAITVAGCTVYEIEIDNTLNAAEAEFVKLYDTAAAVTSGVTVPEYVLRIPAAAKRSFVFPDGLAFASGLAITTVTTAPVAGVTDPTANVTVKIVYA